MSQNFFLQVPTDTHGIMLLQVGKQGTPFNAPQIQDMDKMRLFHIDGGKFNGFPHVTEDVKWLGFPNCQFQMPTSVSIPEGISILDLSKNDYMANVLLENCRSRSVVSIFVNEYSIFLPCIILVWKFI